MISQEKGNLERAWQFNEDLFLWGKKEGLKHNGGMQGLQRFILYLFWKLTVNICPQFQQSYLFYMHSMNFINTWERKGRKHKGKKYCQLNRFWMVRKIHRRKTCKEQWSVTLYFYLHTDTKVKRQINLRRVVSSPKLLPCCYTGGKTGFHSTAYSTTRAWGWKLILSASLMPWKPV